MPVVSPSRYSSTITGTYRSTLSSNSSMDKPYYRSTSGTYVTSTLRSPFGDKTTEFRSRLSDIDGHRERKSSLVEYSRSSRAASGDSDSGISTRYRSDRSESRSRDISTTRSESGKTTDRAARQKALNSAALAMSTAELYNKYSPTNYIPLTQRLQAAQGEIARSKSISGDIGRPPVSDGSRLRKPRNSTIIERPERRYKDTSPTPSYTKRSSITNGIKDKDSNGNDVPSVSEIRKRFDSKMAVTKLPANESASTSRYRKSSLDYLNQLKDCDNSDGYTKIKQDEKPVPVHLPYERNGLNKWETSSSRSNSNSDISSKTLSETVSLKPKSNNISVTLTAKLPERIASIKSQLDPNNPIGKILEKSTVIKVENGEAKRYSPDKKYENGDVKNYRFKIDEPKVSDKKIKSCMKGDPKTYIMNKMFETVDSKQNNKHLENGDTKRFSPDKKVEVAKTYLDRKLENGDIKSPEITKTLENGDAKRFSPEKVEKLENGDRYSPSRNEKQLEIEKQVKPARQSNFASYIQISQPISSGTSTRSNSKEVELNNIPNGDESKSDTKNDTITKINIKYIDSDEEKNQDTEVLSPTVTGFENKTFEHENYLKKRSQIETEDTQVNEKEQDGIKSMETSTESAYSGSSSPELTSRRKILDAKDIEDIKAPRAHAMRCGCRRCWEPRPRAVAPPPRPRPALTSTSSPAPAQPVARVRQHPRVYGVNTYQAEPVPPPSGPPVQPSTSRVRNNPRVYGVHTYQELAGGRSSGVRRSSERSDTSSAADARAERKSANTSGLNGLRNIGNTCFMNSVLQCLSNTRPLLEYVTNDTYCGEINETLSCMKGALIKAFATLIKELWRGGEKDSVVNTTTFKSQVQRFAPRFMGYSQQDAQEFLRYLLEGMHEDVNRVTVKPKPILTEIDDTLSDSAKAAEAWSRYMRMENSHVSDIFVGQLKSTLRCTHCNHDSVTFDPFWDLSLPIPSRTGNLKLQQCLQHFTKEEEMDGDEKPTCSKCGVRRKCLKWFAVQKFPQVLVVHLKRFSPTERFRGKLNVVVEFPLNGLDMSPYAATRGQSATYNLYAVSNHSGTTYSGHYTAYCKHPYTGDWHEYNDSRVSPISPRNVVSSEAYVLFYELSRSSQP